MRLAPDFEAADEPLHALLGLMSAARALDDHLAPAGAPPVEDHPVLWAALGLMALREQLLAALPAAPSSAPAPPPTAPPPTRLLR